MLPWLSKIFKEFPLHNVEGTSLSFFFFLYLPENRKKTWRYALDWLVIQITPQLCSFLLWLAPPQIKCGLVSASINAEYLVSINHTFLN